MQSSSLPSRHIQLDIEVHGEVTVYAICVCCPYKKDTGAVWLFSFWSQSNCFNKSGKFYSGCYVKEPYQDLLFIFISLY